ncbi:DUF4313 domain-containing protein [Cupriavidus pampae]|uniref:Integron gene cassette protein n=1 Tax=Cupriavidus pampae TaxID=659251 RepID=A0ABN7ZJR1_9BURK|nr:DUF4313 domain-containing protein [Cupriavidus pampae]CAG9185733.1 hypothetical protein LMG32289_06080 [Cupriavidus pampae]
MSPLMDVHVYAIGLASYPAGVKLCATVYESNLRAAISLVCADDGMPYGALSVNLSDIELADDEIFVAADWNLPGELKAALLETGKFAQAGRWNQVGHGRGEIWRIADPVLLSQIAAVRIVGSRSKSKRRAAVAA